MGKIKQNEINNLKTIIDSKIKLNHIEDFNLTIDYNFAFLQIYKFM